MENIKERISRFQWELEGRKLRLGVGCTWVGRGGNSTVSMNEDVSLLLKCYEKGFRYFDTSREYGESERVVGEFLRQIDRKTIFLATKCQYRPPKDPDGNFLRQPEAFEQFQRLFYESFERLGVDHIDLYQIHDSESYGICMDEVIPFLEERKKEGMIDYIGMGTRSITAHCQALADGRVDSALSYMDYNLLKLSAEPIIRLAKEKNAAFINSSVLLFGLLKEKDPTEKAVGGLGAKRRHYAKELRDLCQRFNIDSIAASLQFSLLNPDVDMTLNGIKRISNLESTIQAMENPLYPEQWAALFRFQNQCGNIRIPDEANYS